MNKNDYIKNLAATIAKFLEPLRNIPFPLAIKVLAGFEVIPFVRSQPQAQQLLDKIARAAQIAGERAYAKGIFKGRPNEVGNAIEPFVLQALRDVGLRSDKPKAKGGKGKATAYPDLRIDEGEYVAYLECKTYGTEKKYQSFRTFYMSPSNNAKVTANAYHLLLSFEIDRATREGRSAFVPISWQLYTLDKLLVHVKHEFNASNRDLYTRPEALLAEGKIT